MHVFELAEDLKTSPKEVIKFLCSIGYVVKREMDMVPLPAETQVRKQLVPILQKSRAEKDKKDALKKKEIDAKRETERKQRDSERKKNTAVLKAQQKEVEKKAKDDEKKAGAAAKAKPKDKEQEKKTKEDVLPAKTEPKHSKPVAKAEKDKKPVEAGKKEEQKTVAVTHAPVHAKPVAAPAVEKPAAEKHATEKPAAEKHAAEKHPAEKHAAEKHPTEKHAAEKHPTEKPVEELPPVAALPPGGKQPPLQKPGTPLFVPPVTAGKHAPVHRPPAPVGKHAPVHRPPAPPVGKPVQVDNQAEAPAAVSAVAPVTVPTMPRLLPGGKQPPLQKPGTPLFAAVPVPGAHAHPTARRHVVLKPPAPVPHRSGTTNTRTMHLPHAKPVDKKIDLVPLDRIKKPVLTRADEIKNSLEQAQALTLTKRTPREEVATEEPKAKKKERVQFAGVENREELINRPRLSASAELRQQIADRSVVPPAGGSGSRSFRKRQHVPRPVSKPAQQTRDVLIEVPVSVRELSQVIGVKIGDIIGKLMHMGQMVTINQHLDRDTVELLAVELGIQAVIKEPDQTLEQIAFAPEDIEEEVVEGERTKRAPIVTFMGHVDHGKTSLLDAIRQTKVAAGESGGITQHIGAYEVTGPFGAITFIDTPGHEAFTAMRARGAHVTDIAVLVVAADDGLMPQSIEAISHARAANVPIMVAVNKCDLHTANPDRVLAQLAEQNLTPEAWGGETIVCNVSALTKDGIDQLLEMIRLQADVLTDEQGESRLLARVTGPARGSVLEAVLDPNQGPTVTLLVQEGLLQRGDPIVCGSTFGRARALLNYRGEQVESVGPSTPVRVLGFSEVPSPGSAFRVATSERHARELVDERRTEEQLKRHAQSQKITLENFYRSMSSEKVKILPIIVKGDTQGTLEALRSSLERLSVGNAKVQVLHCAVGDITENDIMLATASNAVILGFRVAVIESARAVAKREGVDITMYDVIYHATEAVQAALAGLLEPVFKEVETGLAHVRTVFALSAGQVAGCNVQSGTIQRSNKVRVLRAGETVFDGDIQSLRHIKDEVREVRAGFECGILLRDFKDVKEGDIIRGYKLEREAPLASAT